MQPSPTAETVGPVAPNCRVRCIESTLEESRSPERNPHPWKSLQASRTLVKSPPELWAECSDAASLARHLDRFGEIRITRLEPETAVAWEGERARGTVRIEPAGWGTKVILTAVADDEEAVAPAAPPVAVTRPPEPEEPEPPAEDPVDETPAEEPRSERRRRFARLRAFLRGPEPGAEPPVEEPLAATAIDEPTAATAIEEPTVPEAPPPAPEAPPPAPEAPPPESPEPVLSDTEAALTAALDSLGQAHHRPYSRA